MRLLIEPFRKYVNSYCLKAIGFLRIVTLLFTLLTGYFHTDAQLPMGDNPGYYGAQYTDQQLYDLMYAGGARSTRSSVSLQYDLQYGMPTFQARLQYPYSTKGMRNNTFFLFASAGPTYSTESTKKTAGGHQSWLPTGIYNPAFNSDGTINTANAWAKYVYDVMQSIGPYFTYYEVWNEPDLTSSSDSYNDSTVSKTSWQVREPAPDELLNMYDSLESYVQLCKIANQVVKKYQPTAKICTGGIGYPWFYQWFLRKGGGQWIDELSFHEYPYYDWCYCAWTGTTCGPAGFHRNSDYAANQVLAEFQDLRQIETNEKAVHPPAMMTETNIPRWSYVPAGDMEVFPQNRPWGSDRTQRNFTIKSFTKMIQAGLNIFYFYQTGETADSGLNNGPTGSEIDAMGMYKNLDKATPGKEVFTSHGIATKTMQTLIGNYKIDATQPTFASGIDGVRFDSSGNKIYVIWAVTTLDTLETASASYTLPAGVTFKKYLYDASSPGTVSGTISLTGDPYILVQNVSSSVTCNTGSNQTITLPISSATLDASASTVTNSTISSYQWTQVSGPPNATIANAKTVTATAGSLIAGTYVFQVAIKDANNDSCASTTQITVKPLLTPPTVSAGSNQTITLPSSASLAGTASDATGTITTYAWSEVSGPDNNATFSNGNTISATANNLIAGQYVFQLTVTDNNNLSASATVTITVNPANQPPVVSAGSNQTITLPTNNASLTGSATDATGNITTYAWTEISGPSLVNISNAGTLNASVNNLLAGPYIFQLTVTDNNNLSSSATVNITVNLPNQPPVVSAGSNQTITLPTNTAPLSGTATDATGTITTYAWTEVSGPTTATISNADKLTASAKSLIAGPYVFQLTVTDNNNLSSSATVSIAVNQLPVVDAGSDQTITLPTNSASLGGTASDVTGNINNYSWTEVSGPTSVSISNAGTLNATANNLIAGIYVFQLTVTDDNNLSASATVNITVNQPLVVDAGSDQTIILPTNFASLTGSATDASGNINNYSWTEVSGPSNITTQDLGTNNITVNNLIAGAYVFQLTVTDDNNLSASATVTITVNELPVISAGSDQTITLPNNASLVGAASDATGNITNYSWTEISGPNNATITNANKISATAKNLVGGIYVFQLTVTDDNNLSASATVTITANQLPVVDAGTNQTITLPNNSATLTGTVTDATGNITSYLWTEISGPDNADLSDQELSMTVSNLNAGIYTFQLTVTDDNNLSASATVTITVNNENQAPVVSAGADQTITLPTSASLVGTASDATGTITSYTWTEVSGPNNNVTFTNGNTISATANNLVAGSYVFQLTVTDNNNLSASATVTVTVNQLPVVSAGSNQTITLPTSASLVGNASDATGTITTYAWTEVSGPNNNVTFTNGNTISATANNLVAGSYVFQLTVTDNNNLSASATVNILVKPANQLPVVSAGSNQAITLPANTATLTGTATDATGTITTYAWTEVSGPNNNVTFTNGNTISATANNLVAGSYVFQLTVTDNNNLSASATVSIQVDALPVVSAGSNQTINLPANTATLTGTATDATGTITTYAWTEVSGPSTITITNASKISASVASLVAGSYVFQLKVTDNNNLSASATVTIKVNALPVVSAGSNQTINLPTNTATLTGTATDATGTITTYAWTEVSGPSTITITNANKISASVASLVAGSYVFQLKVTDNNNLSASATVTIKVNALPVVSAGSNQTINLPTNTATLTGTATDATGTITTYAWTEVSGPSTITITNASKISASVASLVAGSYVFQLKVTDNNNLSASATVTIKVNALPVVSAGSNQTINLPTNTATLTGTATDATGTITTYAWTEVSGPSTITITNASKISASVASLVAGAYVFKLTVTDNNSLSASATVTITVAYPPPVVSAGSNQTINLPTSTATLTGTATDAAGTITAYAWTQVSGPGTATITNGTKISASVSKLVAGAYVFQLKVTDNHSLTASATVTITVAYPPPVVSAGSNQTINLPTTTGTLTGTATDATGTITAYAWTEVSGPNTATITNATKISASLSKLVAGTYVFQLKVTDSHSLTATATVTIIVNQLPVANAGTNQTITLPTNKATLSGSKSTDADGTIASYSWTRVSGPSTPTITGNKTVTATISGLIAGTYVYRLTVTDNRGATANATTQITVNAAATGSVINTQTITSDVVTAEPDSSSASVTDKILLFPNPAQSILNIQLTTKAMGTMGINIFNMLGRSVLSMQTDKTQSYFNSSFDISKLSGGVYIMQIFIGESKRMTIKFVKQ